jgi:hypothetical protein
MQCTTGGEGTSGTGSELDGSEADAIVLGIGPGGGIAVRWDWTELIVASMTMSLPETGAMSTTTGAKAVQVIGAIVADASGGWVSGTT